MAPRGLKAALTKSAPARLAGAGKRRGFALVRQGKKTGVKVKGLTKRLQLKVWSAGALPAVARSGERRPGGHWGGPEGGRLRGAKVDAQLSKLINAGPAAWKKARHVYRLTKMALAALGQRGLEPVCAQRALVSERHGVGTAADILAYRKRDNRLVVVELKTGFDHGRLAPAEQNGRPCKMGAPLGRASDCNAHRHLAQLAVTRHLLVQEKATLARLGELGVDQEVDGLLLYVNDQGAEFFALGEWWKKRAPRVLNAIA